MESAQPTTLVCNKKSSFGTLSLLALAATLLNCPAALGQALNLAPISLNPQIAQVQPSPQIIPTDATPFTVNPERNEFNPGYKFRLFQALPERLYFTSSTEVSQRLDTNVLFTSGRAKADYAFRVLPNLTIGYNVAKNTSVFVNYFVIKDQFASHHFLNRPTTQSLAWGVQHNKQLGKKTSLQLTFQARELWQARNLHQFDFIPGATVTHFANPNNVLFASALLQMRGGTYFVAPNREIDPFYTVGWVHRKGPWTLIATDTLVTNFRHPTFKFSVPNQSNVSMIADLEINRPISKRFPSLLAFARAEPIWNWDSKKTPGISGFDFRLYTGLRMIVSKPSYYASTLNMRKQLLKEQNNRSSPTPPPPTSTAPNAAPAETPLTTEAPAIIPAATADGEVSNQPAPATTTKEIAKDLGNRQSSQPVQVSDNIDAHAQ